jgi:hypothetical protein
VSTSIQTYTGRPFYPLEPREQDVDIFDIAHSLSMLCRYNGAVRKFYSVAEHCVLLSHAVDPENAQWALLHDAAEAYIGDMAWPLKQEMPAFRLAEDGIMSVICTKFGLDPVQPEQVTEYDRRIVLDERDALMAPAQIPWPYLEELAPLQVCIQGWSPPRAKVEYELRFKQLFT